MINFNNVQRYPPASALSTAIGGQVSVHLFPRSAEGGDSVQLFLPLGRGGD